MRGLGAQESRAAPQAPAVCGEVDKRGVAMLISREGARASPSRKLGVVVGNSEAGELTDNCSTAYYRAQASRLSVGSLEDDVHRRTSTGRDVERLIAGRW